MNGHVDRLDGAIRPRPPDRDPAEARVRLLQSHALQNNLARRPLVGWQELGEWRRAEARKRYRTIVSTTDDRHEGQAGPRVRLPMDHELDRPVHTAQVEAVKPN